MLLLGLWAFTIVGYNLLPERIPAHMGPGGVTRWTERDSGIWLLLPIMASVHSVLMYGLSGLADSSPEGFNIPQKKRLLELPREAQRYAMEPARPFMFAMATWLITLTLSIQWQMFAAAQAGPGADSDQPFLIALLVLGLLPLVGVVWLNRAIRLRIDGWEAGAADQPSA